MIIANAMADKEQVQDFGSSLGSADLLSVLSLNPLWVRNSLGKLVFFVYLLYHPLKFHLETRDLWPGYKAWLSLREYS